VIRAYSNNTSPSSAFASMMTKAIGAEKVVKDAVNKNTRNKILADKYRKQARDRAKQHPRWKEFADLLDVEITESNFVKISVKGSAEVQKQAELLEYGSSTAAPQSLLRVFETEFSDDVALSMRGFNA